MKLNLLLLVFVIGIVSFDLKSQDYAPFPESTARWSNTFLKFWEPGINEPMESFGYYYEMKGDSTINGIEYNKLFYQTTWHKSVYEDHDNQQTIVTTSNSDGPGRLIGLLRQDLSERRIYFRKLGIEEFGCHSNDIPSNEDYLLYDFNLEIGDAFSFISVGELIVQSIDSFELIDGNFRRSFNFLNDIRMIEGIGSNFGLFGPVYFVEGGCRFNCFREDDSYLISEGSTFYCDSVDIISNVKNIQEKELDFNIIPNPFHDNLSVSVLDGNARELNLKLFDIWGVELLNKSMKFASSMDLELQNIPTGIYIMLITDQTNRNYFTKKLLKVN